MDKLRNLFIEASKQTYPQYEKLMEEPKMSDRPKTKLVAVEVYPDNKVQYQLDKAEEQRYVLIGNPQITYHVVGEKLIGIIWFGDQDHVESVLRQRALMQRGGIGGPQ
jgi:hypothetical protein